MSKKMTIGYILDDTLDKSDGVQQAVISIGEKMRALGHEVHYIVPHTKRKDIANVHSVARIISLKFNGNSIRTPIWSSKKKIDHLFTNYSFDVLHVQMPYSPLMAGRVLLSAPEKVRIFGTFHILPYNRRAAWGTKLLGYILSRSKRKIIHSFAVSYPALTFMKNSFGLSGSVLPNPVDYQFFHKHSSVIKKTDKYTIVFVGRFDIRKGVRQLVLAFERVLESVPEAKLVMCGKGPLLVSLQEYAKDNNLPISFLGFVSEEEKAKQLARASIAVFPSTAGESFGIVLTEAMASGSKITLGGDNPGYRSVLEPWPSVLFDPNNIPAFAEKLRHFLLNDKESRFIGNMQHHEVKQYDIEKVCEVLEARYQKHTA